MSSGFPHGSLECTPVVSPRYCSPFSLWIFLTSSIWFSSLQLVCPFWIDRFQCFLYMFLLQCFILQVNGNNYVYILISGRFCIWAFQSPLTSTSCYLSFVLFGIQLVQVPQPLCSSIGVLSQPLGSVDVQDTNRKEDEREAWEEKSGQSFQRKT